MESMFDDPDFLAPTPSFADKMPCAAAQGCGGGTGSAKTRPPYSAGETSSSSSHARQAGLSPLPSADGERLFTHSRESESLSHRSHNTTGVLGRRGEPHASRSSSRLAGNPSTRAPFAQDLQSVSAMGSDLYNANTQANSKDMPAVGSSGDFVFDLPADDSPTHRVRGAGVADRGATSGRGAVISTGGTSDSSSSRKGNQTSLMGIDSDGYGSREHFTGGDMGGAGAAATGAEGGLTNTDSLGAAAFDPFFDFAEGGDVWAVGAAPALVKDARMQSAPASAATIATTPSAVATNMGGKLNPVTASASKVTHDFTSPTSTTLSFLNVSSSANALDLVRNSAKNARMGTESKGLGKPGQAPTQPTPAVGTAKVNTFVGSFAPPPASPRRTGHATASAAPPSSQAVSHPPSSRLPASSSPRKAQATSHLGEDGTLPLLPPASPRRLSNHDASSAASRTTADAEYDLEPLPNGGRDTARLTGTTPRVTSQQAGSGGGAIASTNNGSASFRPHHPTAPTPRQSPQPSRTAVAHPISPRPPFTSRPSSGAQRASGSATSRKSLDGSTTSRCSASRTGSGLLPRGGNGAGGRGSSQPSSLTPVRQENARATPEFLATDSPFLDELYATDNTKSGSGVARKPTGDPVAPLSSAGVGAPLSFSEWGVSSDAFGPLGSGLRPSPAAGAPTKSPTATPARIPINNHNNSGSGQLQPRGSNSNSNSISFMEPPQSDSGSAGFENIGGSMMAILADTASTQGAGTQAVAVANRNTFAYGPSGAAAASDSDSNNGSSSEDEAVIPHYNYYDGSYSDTNHVKNLHVRRRNGGSHDTSAEGNNTTPGQAGRVDKGNDDSDSDSSSSSSSSDDEYGSITDVGNDEDMYGTSQRDPLAATVSGRSADMSASDVNHGSSLAAAMHAGDESDMEHSTSMLAYAQDDEQEGTSYSGYKGFTKLGGKRRSGGIATDFDGNHVKRRLVPLDYFRDLYLIEAYLGEDAVSQSYRVRERRSAPGSDGKKRRFVARVFFTDKGKNFFTKNETKNLAARSNTLLSQPMRQQVATALLLDHPKLVRSYDFFYHAMDDAEDIKLKMQSILTAGLGGGGGGEGGDVEPAQSSGDIFENGCVTATAGKSTTTKESLETHLNPRLYARGELGLTRRRVSLLTSQVLLPRRASFVGVEGLLTSGKKKNGTAKHAPDTNRGHSSSAPKTAFSSVEVQPAVGPATGTSSSGTAQKVKDGGHSTRLPPIDKRLTATSSSGHRAGGDKQGKKKSKKGKHHEHQQADKNAREAPRAAQSTGPASTAGKLNPSTVVTAAPPVEKTPQEKLDELLVKLNSQVYEDNGDVHRGEGGEEEPVDLLVDTAFIYGILVSELVSGPMPPALQADRRSRVRPVTGNASLSPGSTPAGLGLEEELVAFYCAQICEVLQYLHEFYKALGAVTAAGGTSTQGSTAPVTGFHPSFLHNNLRGEHILLDAKGNIKLAQLDNTAWLTAEPYFKLRHALQATTNSSTNRGAPGQLAEDALDDDELAKSMAMLPLFTAAPSAKQATSTSPEASPSSGLSPSTRANTAPSSVTIPFPIVPIDLTAAPVYTPPELSRYVAVLRHECEKQAARRQAMFAPLPDAAELLRDAQNVTRASYASFNYTSHKLEHDLITNVTPAVDCYQLGITLYRLLLGRLPFLQGAAPSPQDGAPQDPQQQQQQESDTVSQSSRQRKRPTVATYNSNAFVCLQDLYDGSPAYGQLSADARALLEALILRSPEQRPTVAQILAHPFLTQRRRA